MNPSIFKAYDIRGVVPDDLDISTARRIGKTLIQLYQPKRVLVGRDMRETSTGLQSALVEALVSSGAVVTDIGLCSTPMFNFAVGEAAGKYDLGIMVTASHNPAKYNGFKLVKSDCLPIGQGTGMEQIKELATSDAPIIDGNGQGSVETDDGVLDRYLKKITALAALPADMPFMKIAIDAGNGMAGLGLPSLTKRLTEAQIVRLYWELDGNFPHHEANPLKIETLKDLQQAIKHEECTFGAAFDGDADRIGFLDENGEPIPGDILTALFAREILRDHPGATVLYDLRSSWSVPEIVAEAGGQSEMCRVGHAMIKKMMREQKAVFAGELSMHFYFNNMWNCESGDLALLLMAKIIARENRPLSAIWKPLRRYAHSEEINFKVTDAAAVMKNLEAHYATTQPTAVTHLDGLKMEWRRNQPDDWWFNVRASNTEPLLRLNLEALTPDELQRRQDELSRLIAP